MCTRSGHDLKLSCGKTRFSIVLAWGFLMIPFGQSNRGLKCISDLTSVPALSLFSRSIKPLLPSELHDLGFIDINLEAAIDNTFHVHLPYLECWVFFQFGIVELNVNTRRECFVEFANSIRSKDEDARIILQNP